MIGREIIGVLPIGANPVGNAEQIPLLGGITIIAFAPVINAGNAVQVPLIATIATATKLPHISISAKIKPPATSIVVTTHAPAFGRTIRPHVLGAVTISVPTVRVSAGTSPRIPRANVLVAIDIPRIATGTNERPPATPIGVVAQLPHISISAKIKPPVAPVTIATLIPFIRTGVNIAVANTVVRQRPLGGLAAESITQYSIGGGAYQTQTLIIPPTINVNPNAPDIRTGTHINIPLLGSVGVSANSPSIRAGAHVDVPMLGAIVVTTQKPKLVIGAAIFVANSIVRQIPFGGISSDSIAQHSIGGGDTQSQTLTLSPTININAFAPSIKTGTSLRPPTTSITVRANIPEITTRSRAVAVYIIPN